MHLTYVFIALFIALIIFNVLFIIKDSEDVINNSYNKREGLYAEKTIRGSILSTDGKVLAYTDISNGKEVRKYPYGSAFAHVVGYDTKGKAGVESIATFKLLRSNILITDRILNEANGIKNPGDNVITTLDVNAQLSAYDALGSYMGAVILINADTGEILAMVSKPDFDPNQIADTWDGMTEDKGNSTLLNRATQGVYPPGSTFKIITALEYMKENPAYENYQYYCDSSFTFDGTTINCYHKSAHKDVDFESSFAKSCNASFANITATLDKNKFKETCDMLLFNKKIPCPFNCAQSLTSINASSNTDELLQTGIGQGKTEISPYHMCLICAAIANDGVLMTPYIIKSVETAYGDKVSDTIKTPYKRLISSEDSANLKKLMRSVITDGTGKELLDTKGYIAYGKTGSAEFSSDKSKSHAWFAGFASTDSGDNLAICVIVENGGSGGKVAIPIAKRVFDGYIYK